LSRDRFRWAAVVKVGGSLGRRRGRLETLLRALARLARHRPILVVPGGGYFADGVRREMRRLRLSEAAAHAMALLAMDQYGLALADREPAARAVTTLGAARRVARAGRLPILLVARLAGRSSGLEKSFRLTSDSIAAWLASRCGAPRLVLIKSLPGLDLGLPDAAAARRAARAGLVDPLFPRFMDEGIDVRLIGGRGARTWALRDGVPDGRARDASRPRRPPAQRGSRRRGAGRSVPPVLRRTGRRAPRRDRGRPPRSRRGRSRAASRRER
jgi:aspartokinase-like uncharacterized kinase